MILIGAVLIILGWLLPGLSVLVFIGVIFLVCGLVLLVAGSTGHEFRGRRHYW